MSIYGQALPTYSLRTVTLTTIGMLTGSQKLLARQLSVTRRWYRATADKNLHTIAVDEAVTIDGLTVTGIKTTHGNLVLKIGPISTTVKPGPTERIGWGAIGFSIHLGTKHLVNLGDTLLHTSEWKTIAPPDVLMVPIGGKVAHNTMDEDEALEAVSIMKPALAN